MNQEKLYIKKIRKLLIYSTKKQKFKINLNNKKMNQKIYKFLEMKIIF